MTHSHLKHVVVIVVAVVVGGGGVVVEEIKLHEAVLKLHIADLVMKRQFIIFILVHKKVNN